MADLGQMLATGGTALVSAAAGAGLTYWLGAMNRRHQEAREDETRWYEERLRAYAEFTRAGMEAGVIMKGGSAEERSRVLALFQGALGSMLLLSSPEVQSAGRKVLFLYSDRDETNFSRALAEFTEIASKDLGITHSRAERHVAVSG